MIEVQEKTTWSKLQSVWNAVQDEDVVPIEAVVPSVQAGVFSTGGFDNSGFNDQHLFTFSYTGEKNPGEMGAIKRYRINYRALRARSWQAFLDSDAAQAVMKKFTSWIIGGGLKIQANPVTGILADNGITVPDGMIKQIEDRFRLYSDSKTASFDNQMTLHQLAFEAEKNTTVAGDVLAIMRVEKGRLTTQLVDGDHVFTPMIGSKELLVAKNNGNRIKHGVELDKNNRHVAYFVRLSDGTFERVVASDPRGRQQAFLIYGTRYRLDNVRGIPLMSAGLEVIKKLDRYKEAAVGGAEERAKIALFIEHDMGGTGENPFTKNIRSSLNLNKDIPGANADVSQHGQKAAELIAATTQKQAFNLPPGATIKAPSSDMELGFNEFFMTNFQVFCAAVEIPIEVALSKYDSNFSASRAALKEWEHTIFTKRKDFVIGFYEEIYRRWFLLENQRGDIEAPGLFESFRRDRMLFEAYTKARFIGANVPHIDPLKEVKAVRAKLGALGKDIPLTTADQATEELSEGDFDSNMIIFSEELKTKETLIPTPEPTGENSSTGHNDEEEE